MLKDSSVTDNDVLCWFAMSAPFQKELEAQRLLDKLSIENYVPMCYRVVVRNKKKRREWCPAIHNLIFVRSTRKVIQEAKTCYIPFLQYLTRQSGGRNLPIVVPDNQMQQFIQASSVEGKKLIYLTVDELGRLNQGVRVRVIGGPFDGVEGIFQRVKGCRSKRVVIWLQGIIAVVLAEIHPDLIELLE